MWQSLPRLPRPEFASIRGRLLWSIGLVFSAAMIALYLAATSYAKLAADRSFDRVLAGSASSIAETLSITQDRISVDIPYAALDMLAAAPDDKVFYRIAADNDATVTGYADLPRSNLEPSRVAADHPIFYFDAPYRGEQVRFAVLVREVGMAGKTAFVRIQIGQTRAARAALARELTLRALVPILLMTLLALVVIWLVVGRAVRPLEQIGAELSRREPSDLSMLDETRVPREVSSLIGAMNQFMSRLASSMGFLRNFVGDVAHQLRTPLTAMLVQQREAEVHRGPESTRALGAARASAERLVRLVDQLLSDALVTHRAEERIVTPYDLKRAIEHALHTAAPVDWHAEVRFTCALGEALLPGDETMVTEAVKNLVHNALTHGDAVGGFIDITLGEAAGGLLLTIDDCGPGMAESELAGLGKRFMASRSSRSGAGLGLAIVDQVVRSQHGRLTLRNRPSGGLSAHMWLPRA